MGKCHWYKCDLWPHLLIGLVIVTILVLGFGGDVHGHLDELGGAESNLFLSLNEASSLFQAWSWF